MKHRTGSILLGITAVVLWGSITTHGQTEVTGLRCEYLNNPQGIDVAAPRLSWKMVSSERGQVQTAYRLIVASDAELLGRDIGDLWDTGKVLSDRSNQVEYRGKPLRSRMRCYWKVRVWDKDGEVCDWSEPAFWSMGLLERRQWRAEWIGYDAEPPAPYEPAGQIDPLAIDGCKWLWYPGGNPKQAAPVGRRFFRRRFEIPPGSKIEWAKFRLIADNEGTLFVNGQLVQKFQGWSPPYTLDVDHRLKEGLNVLAIVVENQGDKPNPAGLGGKLVVRLDGAEDIVLRIDRSWKASDTEQAGWQSTEFDDSGWAGAVEVAECGEGPWGQIGKSRLVLPPPPYLRKEFSVNRPVRRATLYASALGLYEVWMNGKRVGEYYFTPGWTDYNKRIYYQSYDVTGQLRQGRNAVGAILADGWYAGYVGFGKKREHYGDKPRLLVQLELEYADGGRDIIYSDGSWKAAYGAILEADFLMGETCDARKERRGWAEAGFDDSGWDKVAVSDWTEAVIQSYPGVPVRRIMEIKPKKRIEPKPGVYVFDMGQNFTGWVRLRARGPAGTKIALRFAEMLNPDGTIYTKNLREARCTDTYVLAGDGTETWEPRFTYHGFRYVEVTGYPGKPGLDAVTGVVVHSDTPVVGSFRCSSPMVNQLYSNIVWSQRGNFIEIPTDCPQRDERLGWTGDAQIFIRTATYNMDVAAFFTKWLVDLEDAQSPEGAFPDVAPHKVATGSGVPAWGDAGVICPWTIHQVYGDERVLEKHYDSMVKWIEYLQRNSKDLLRPAYGYGDWLSINSKTPKDVIGTAYFAYSTRLTAEVAAAIGRPEDAARYMELFDRIKKAFNKAYVSADGRIKGDTQTCYLLGLHFDLLSQKSRGAAAEHLVADIEARDWHLSTGFVGASYLLPTLTEVGRLDVAYRLLLQETFPSWGYSIANGATTIWERWDGWTQEKGFQDPGMNSFNHYAFGSVGRWMFNTIAGIDTDGPGYKHIRIRPRPGGGLTFARARYDSIHGPVRSEWKISRQRFTLEIEVPANTTATVHVPAEDAAGVKEGSRAAVNTEAVRLLAAGSGEAVFAVGSGTYRFSSRLPAEYPER